MFSRIKDLLSERFEGEMNLSIAQMDDFYYGLDIFVITSDKGTESFGRVLVEAMSRKVVVIGTNCGGATEVISDKCNIYEDEKGIYMRIEYLIDNRDMLAEQKEFYFQQYINTYSVKNNTSKHMELYRKIELDLNSN